MDREQLLKQEIDKNRRLRKEQRLYQRRRHNGKAGAPQRNRRGYGDGVQRFAKRERQSGRNHRGGRHRGLDKIIDSSVDDSVKIYLKDIGKVPLLTADQEIELAKRMEEGDEEAKHILSEANLRLVGVYRKTLRWQRASISRPHSRGQPRLDESG